MKHSLFPTATLSGILLVAGCSHAPPLDVARRELLVAQAQIAAMPFPAKLTITEARQIALAYNVNLQRAAQSVRAAAMAYHQQLGAYLPALSADFTLNSGLENNVDAYNLPATEAPYRKNFNTQWGLRASWLLFDGMVREFETLSMRAAVRRSEDERRDLARLLLRAVNYAFCDVLLAQAEIRIAEADLAFQLSALEQAEIRFAAGHVAEAELLNFRIRTIRAKCRKIEAHDLEVTATFALANLLGLPEGKLPEGTELVHAFPALPELESAETWIDRAIASRSDLAAWAESVRIARYARSAAIGAFFPKVTGVLNFSGTSNHYDFRRYTIRRSSFYTWDFSGGLVAEWELFGGFSRINRLRETAALAEAAQSALNDRALAVIQEVRTAHEEYRTRRRLAAEYRTLLDTVFRQRELVAREYWAGHVTVTRLNEAQSDLVDAENALASAEIDVMKAASGLLAAAGGTELPGAVYGPRWFDRPFAWLERQTESAEVVP